MAESSQSIVCPDCGATLSGRQARCWLCRRKLDADFDENPYASPRPTAEDSWQVSLASLFLIAMLVAICLGVFLLAPGLGIMVSVFATPALIRTMVDVAQHKQAGAPLSAFGKIGSFVVSLFVVGAVAMAACIAFAAVCFASAVGITAAEGIDPKTIGPNEVVFAFLIGALAALIAVVNVFWLTRPGR